jgi:thioredoxin reductase (NADPH)
VSDERPVILAVDDDPTARARISEELERYYVPYRVEVVGSAAAARDALESARARGDAIAVILSDQWLDDGTGEELLAFAKGLYPRAKRALLIEFGAWGDAATAAAIKSAMAVGTMDYYVLKPWRPHDELFHRTLGEFLHEWSRSDSPEPRELAVVGDAADRRVHEVRSLLVRNGVPHAFYARAGADAVRLLDRAGVEDTTRPVVLTLDGRVLVDPTNAELARSYGVNTELSGSTSFDVAIVGAGPAGLAAAVYASAEGFRALVVEGEAIGGQAGTSSRIRNYLGFPRGVSGAELAQRAYQQAWVFGAEMLLMRRVVGVRPEEGRFVLSISDSTEVDAGAVVLAMGVTYRRLGVPALEGLIDAGVFYGASVSEAQACAGLDVFVVGGGNSAGQAALHLARYARRVTLVVRKATLASTMSSYLRDELAAAPNVEVRSSTTVVDGGGDPNLERLVLADPSGAREQVHADALFVLIGAEPGTEWLGDAVARDAAGFVLTGRDVDGDPDRFPYETSTRGIFAVGDVRAGSVKRVASAVGEGSIVMQHVAARVVRTDGRDGGGRR